MGTARRRLRPPSLSDQERVRSECTPQLYGSNPALTGKRRGRRGDESGVVCLKYL